MLNKKSKRKRIILVILIIAGIALVGSIKLLYGLTEQSQKFPTDLGSYLETGDYEIDPNTILADLDRGEANLFSPMLATPDGPTSLSSGSFPWHQKDYLKIANALHQFVWKEPTNKWNLYSLQFNRECQNGLSGFDSAELTFYTTIKVNGEQVYAARGMGIYPLYKMVSWGGNTNFPRQFIFGWESIDLKKLYVTADHALRIAEQSGGQNARSTVNNNCGVYVTISHGYWYVLYSGEAFSRLFYVRINAGTGRYNILNTKN